MDLPDDRILIGIKPVVIGIRRKALRIGGVEIDDHAAVAVHADCLRIRVGRFLRADCRRDRVGVIGAAADGLRARPDTLLRPFHIDGQEGFAAVARLEEVQHHAACRRRPDLERRFAAVDDCSEIVAVVGPVFDEILRAENIGRNRGRALIALDLYLVELRNVEVLFELDHTHGDLVVQARQAFDLELLVAVPDRDLIEALDPKRGRNAVFDLVFRNDTDVVHCLLLHKRCSAVVAVINRPFVADEVDFRVAVHLRIPVAVIDLRRIAPGRSARLGAVDAHDKSDLRDVLRHVDHALRAVRARPHRVAPAVLAGKPHPHVARFKVDRIRFPVNGQLIHAFLFFQELLFRLCGIRFRFGRCLLDRLRRLRLFRRGLRRCFRFRFGRVRRGISAAGNQSENHHQCQKTRNPSFPHRSSSFSASDADI